MQTNWECPKCRNRAYETGQFQATGGTFAKLMDIQNKKFSTVTCTQCQYTEIYRTSSSGLLNILDFLGN
jgi:predicted nucleic-acid-binding Zn-ribbon protein